MRRVTQFRTTNDLYRWAARRARKIASTQKGQTIPLQGASSDGNIAWIRRQLGHVITVPDEARGWIRNAATATRRLVSAVRPSVVVSTGPPHSAHLAAWLASWGKQCRFLIDLRDPWVGHIAPSWRYHPGADGIARWSQMVLRRFVMPKCDGIICATNVLATLEQAANPALPVSWVPNGVDAAEVPKVKRSRVRGLTLTHAGTIYGGRNIEPVLRAFARYLDEYPDERELGAQIQLVGNVQEAAAQRFRATAQALGVGGQLHVLGTRPRAETLKILARSHVGLLLAQDQTPQVPAKLYELAAMGLDVLAITERDSATWRECQRLGLHVVEPADQAGMVAILRAIRHAPSQGPSPDLLTAVDYASLSELMDRVLRNEQ